MQWADGNPSGETFLHSHPSGAVSSATSQSQEIKVMNNAEFGVMSSSKEREGTNLNKEFYV